MDEEDRTGGTVVDPEVRAYVNSLVSALGGTAADEDGHYVLGDDALACLKDIKRWLKLYDEKANRLDVARCLAEANLVNGDLLEILATWPEDATAERKMISKVALACLELLVPLTWPIEKDELQMTVNHHRHLPYLQNAQLSYKRGILEHGSAMILRTVVRIGLPSIALPMSKRSSRDEGIIRLLLYFFRNVAMITLPPNRSVKWDQDEISRSSTIEAFHSQDVLALILTIASNMGEDFSTQDVVLLELLFHLVKGIDIEKMFLDEQQLDVKKAEELENLLSRERNMHRDYAKHGASRHNRFGTMIWVKRDDARVSTVSGQDVLANSQYTFSKMDQSKKWNRPKHGRRQDEGLTNRFTTAVSLEISASRHLLSFVEEFLDSGFNPLFTHVRKAVEREVPRVSEHHEIQFFYLVSWFLEAERVRRRVKRESDMKKTKVRDVSEPDSFALVASVLNQETFIALNRFMQSRLDRKETSHELTAGMRCFTQILLTVQEMSESALEEDQEIAENIQNRIFYEEATHDRIIAILRGYKDQGFGYLDACTQLSHVFLRMLERYSKENADLQVRSKRRARRKKKAQVTREDDDPNQQTDDSEAEDEVEAQRISSERKFDFKRFSAKFMTQSCINTFVAFTTFYKDLNPGQLKRAHRFFYRVAFKAELSVLLFRLDIIALFNKMIKGPEGLDPANPMFKEWDQYTIQIIRKMTKKLQQRPELAVELLFSKVPSTTHYLEYGYEKQTMASKPRPPATLEVKGAMTKKEQIGVAVAILYEEKLDSIDWVIDVLSSAISERQSWEAEASARQIAAAEAQETTNEHLSEVSKASAIVVKPDTEARRLAIFKDARLRLLMTLIGFERLASDEEDSPSATWIIPSNLTSSLLREACQTIQAHRDDPKMQYGDNNDEPVNAEDMLRRKAPPRNQRAEFDDDSEGDGFLDGELDFTSYPAGGPTVRKSDVLEELKKKRRTRKHIASSGSGEESETENLPTKAKPKSQKVYKSELYVIESEDDEEKDREFFEREEARRKRNQAQILTDLHNEKSSNDEAARPKKRQLNMHDFDPSESSGRANKTQKKKQRRTENDLFLTEDDEVPLASVGSSSSSPAPDPQLLQLISSDEEADDNTPISSPQHHSSSQDDMEITKSTEDRIENLASPEEKGGGDEMNEDGDEEEGLLILRKRKRARPALLVESDDEE